MLTLHLNFMFKVISHDDDDLSIESYKQCLQQHYNTLSNINITAFGFFPVSVPRYCRIKQQPVMTNQVYLLLAPEDDLQ